MIANLRTFLHDFFSNETIQTTATQTGAFERKRKLTPLAFTVALGFLKADTIAYSDIAADIQLATGEKISAQAISDKVKKSEAMFKTLVATAIARSKSLPTTERFKIAGVADILVGDASTIALRNSLQTIFPGTGGNGPKASVKLHGLFNLTTSQMPYLALTEGTRSDQTTKEDHIAISKEGDLLTRDLGYFELDDLQKLKNNRRFFISRIPLKIRHFAESSGEPLDIWDVLASTKGYLFERTLMLGEENFLTRVIALRLPRKKWRTRLKELRKEKGRQLTRREETQTKWNLLTTNLSTEQASAETIQKLYELRWQIELLWKALKTSLGIDSLRAASCENIVRAFIWAKLLCAVILLTARGLLSKNTKREIGLIRWFRRVAAQFDKIRGLIMAQRWLALAHLLEILALGHCLAEKHSKASTREKVHHSIALDRKRRKVSMP